MTSASVTERARATAHTHGKSYPLVLADMLWSAARHRVGFNDYIEFDFAILTRAERATWVTSPLALEFSNRYDDPAQVHRFHDKIDFNRDFDRVALLLEPACDSAFGDALTERGHLYGDGHVV